MSSATAPPPYRLRSNDVLMQADHDKGRTYVLRFRDLADEEKPREKILSVGVQQLTMAELVALLLGTGNTREDVMVLSKRIIKEYGEKALVNETDPRRLAEALDIPMLKASQLVACFELGRRYYARQAGKPVMVRHSKQAIEYLKPMGDLRKEQLRGLYLNSRYQVIHDEVISVGSLTANIVHPREVFQPAIEHGAVAVLIAHNHPSGDLNPTLADTEITDQLVAAGRLLGIDLLDHIIIAGDRYVSLLANE